MKIYITRDINSAFFVSELYEDAASMEAEGEITEQEWKEWQEILANYLTWQDRFADMHEKGKWKKQESESYLRNMDDCRRKK